MHIKFTPPGEDWEGTITVDVKSTKDRTENGINLMNKDDAEKGAFMTSLIQDSIISVDLVHLASGIHIVDKEELGACAEGFELMQTVIGGYLLSGVPLAQRAEAKSKTTLAGHTAEETSQLGT